MSPSRIVDLVTKRTDVAVMVIVALVLSSAGLCAQGTGAGARSEGMGGAFIGVADDAMAVSWNPAGLVQLETAQAAVDVRFRDSKSDFTVPTWPSLNASAHQSHAALNFGSLALPLDLGTVKFVPALAYQRQIDLYRRWAAGTLSQQEKGGIGTITPGFGVKIGPVLSVGASANFWMGTHDQAWSDGDNSSGTSHTTFKGFNMEAGALVDLAGLSPALPVKVGLRWRTPFDLKETGTERSSPISITTEMPSMVGVGASVCFFERLTLAADYELLAYAEKRIRREMAGFRTWTSRISGDNIKQYRIGCEHVIVANEVAIPLRIGYTSVPRSFYFADGFHAKNAYSFGTGIHVARIAIDAAYTQLDYMEYGGGDETSNRNTTLSVSLAVSM